MKTETMVIVGLVVVGAYFIFGKKKEKPVSNPPGSESTIPPHTPPSGADSTAAADLNDVSGQLLKDALEFEWPD